MSAQSKLTQEEALGELRRIIPAGTEFGVSEIQRHFGWGYPQAHRTLMMAVESGRAKYVEGSSCRIAWTPAGIFHFGGQNVGNRQIHKGLLYMDSRDQIARVHDHFEGLVVLDWIDSGKQSQCSEKGFRRRFYLYGNGHSEPV